MAKLLSEINKVDIAIVPASINGPSTGTYYNMGLRNKALFVWETGTMAAGVTSVAQVMQAQDAAGTGGKVVTNNAATITANTKVAAATLTVDTVVATNKVTINGLTFEAAAAADLANRKFAVGADDAGCAAAGNVQTDAIQRPEQVLWAGILPQIADQRALEREKMFAPMVFAERLGHVARGDCHHVTPPPQTKTCCC